MIVQNEILIPTIGQLIKDGKEVVFTPTGNSMRPFIEGGKDVVRLAACPYPTVGDIVLARDGERYILHRIYARTGDHITLMGDGNLQGTEHITTADILARVVEIQKANGQVHIPGRARWWRHSLRCRWLMLKIYRKIIK